MRARSMVSAVVMVLLGSQAALAADKKYDTGASDTEIKIGNTMAYSGQGSAWGQMGKAEAAYFDKINAEGGTDGRSSSSVMMMPTARRKRWSRCANWWSTTRCCCCSVRSAFRPTPLSTNT